MKKIIAILVSVLLITSCLTALSIGVYAASSQTVNIPIGLPGSGSEKYIVSSSATYVVGARYNDCFRTTIFKFVFPSDTTTATAVASINNAVVDTKYRVARAGYGAFAFAASTDMVNWTDIKKSSSDNAQALPAEEKGNIDVSMDLTAFLKTNKIVFVKVYDKTILAQGGLDPLRGTVLRAFKVTYNSSKELNTNKNFDGFDVEAARWVNELDAVALTKDVAQLVQPGDYVRHGTDMGSPGYGYSSAAFLGIIPTIYKFKLNPGTKKAALAIELQYAYRLDVSADKKSWTKLLTAPYIEGSETPEDPNNVKHHTLAIPSSAIAADGTVYVRLSEGTAWHMSIGVAATELVKASVVTPVPTKSASSVAASSATQQTSVSESSVASTDSQASSDVSSQAVASSESAVSSESDKSEETSKESQSSKPETDVESEGLPMPLIIVIAVAALGAIGAVIFFILKRKK